MGKVDFEVDLDEVRKLNICEGMKSELFDTLVQMVDGSGVQDVMETKTSSDQSQVESMVREIYEEYLHKGEPLPVLRRQAHIDFLQKIIANPLPSMYKVLDASHPWMIYWCINALSLLGAPVSKDTKRAIALNIISFVHPNGGIGGGVGQIGHAAASYAAICSLALSEDEEVWSKLDRDAIYLWIMKDLKQSDGSFIMHVDGEVDTRAVYCVLCIASMLNIMTPELIKGVPEWLQKCQTYEGGFGGTPGDEAHGGYTFCAVLSLCILGSPKEMLTKYCDFDTLVNWVAMRQLSLEGGFSGRTNKLVDGCYSHWVGGVVPFLEIVIGSTNSTVSRPALCNYILMCCQSEKFPGLVDKPGKSTDFYHTNYVLCGLSLCQNLYHYTEPEKGIDSFLFSYTTETLLDSSSPPENKLESLNPIFGLPLGVAEKMKRFFMKL